MNRSSVTTPHHHNTQRRIFRGRGGATDRNHLSDHGARRRRRHESRSTNDVTHNNNNNDHPNEPDDDDVNLELYQLEIIDPFVTEESASTTPPIFDPEPVVGEEDHHDDNDDATLLWVLRQELQHITRRMQQLRRNWSTSKTGLVLPSNYATNVLQATLNIIRKEWQSILRQYYYYYDNGETSIRCDAVVVPAAAAVVIVAASREKLLRPVSHDIFALIQQSIQCGPLTGSQAGYFKRCGSHIAQMVYDYLTTILPTSGDQPVDRRKVVNDRHDDDDSEDDDDDSQEDDDDDDSEDDDDENDNTEAASNIDATTLPHQQQQTDSQQLDEQQQQQQQQHVPNSSPNDVLPAVTCFFTDSQIKMIQTWKRNAYKAAVINPKAPSKSMMHQEYQAKNIQNEKKRIKALKGR